MSAGPAPDNRKEKREGVFGKTEGSLLFLGQNLGLSVKIDTKTMQGRGEQMDANNYNHCGRENPRF